MEVCVDASKVGGGGGGEGRGKARTDGLARLV